MRMLKRNTDPKTGKHTLCKPAQAKGTRTFHKSYFVWEFTGKMPNANPAASILCEPAHSKCTWAFDKRHFVQQFTGKMPNANPRASILCEPARSQCTWTFHKKHFVRKFTRKMPDANPAASILCEPAQSKCTWTFHKKHFVRKFTGKMPDASDTTSIEHRPLTVTVRTLSVATLFGEKHVWPWCRVCKSKRKPRHADFMGLGLSCARIFGSAAHAQQTPHSCSDLHPRQVRAWVGWGGMTKDFQTRTEGTSPEAAPKTSRAHAQH